ncbi:MAG: methylated-DNA--[protein]-cysteine S-methyltransferase [Bacteroidota bacterium]|nr:methylated-DNA--[protein]-cysteine S-methyltransferase [Bacteroidota bacterium]MDP4247640.1 methylated-DNA--[protein]-cysteine S-methyltransferase [Bacteroidota bacterium]MDP4254924.1 methylated-DNA--[protein]-cysteine S-methyltransferase [Bacteroidota bacterium]MDP4259700.1 methylated-DNA--[protein]-cysteine S-methyltransferase [Bacteroidota bacterium]
MIPELTQHIVRQTTSAYYRSPLGLLRISATDMYVSEISFIDHLDGAGDDGAEWKGPLSPIVIQCIEQLIQYFGGQRRLFDFPVHQEGSDFQKRVWNELTSIPYGKTISYLEQARRLGDTNAIRAVASANGKNNIAIVVPCHRVIGSKRDLVGYGGGLWRKKWLLEHETKILYGVQTLF